MTRAVKSFRPRHVGTFRPVSRQYAKAVKATARAAKAQPALAEPAIRKLERDKQGLTERADLARRLAHTARIAGDADEAQLQTATAENLDGQAAAIDEQIAAIRGGGKDAAS